MQQRFVSIWFRQLPTDWYSLRQPQLKSLPLILRTKDHGRMIVSAVNSVAEQKGIVKGMTVADARAFVHNLEVLDDKPELPAKLLQRLAEWCIRFTPVVAIDLPDGLIMDVTGCAHLWGGETQYLKHIIDRLSARGYDINGAMADTIGVAWGVARFSRRRLAIVDTINHLDALMDLPPEALRLEPENIDRLHKLGLHKIRQFIRMPRTALRRRFGHSFLLQLDKATGREKEFIEAVIPPEPYQERVPCLEPIVTLPGIEIALQQLLEALCLRLQQEQKGLRVAVLKGYRIDGKVEAVHIATNRPSHHVQHLFKLFQLKLSSVEPALGIELFVLDAMKVEDHLSQQEKMWEDSGGLDDERLSELIDRIASKVGINQVNRFLPEEHYWPERSFKSASSLTEEGTTQWPGNKRRPIHLLSVPQRIEVSAPIPDYPPMLFRYKDEVHNIVEADGPERIEQEWWLEEGEHRDYYCVEDEQGHRYWLFRLGHYHDKIYQWFIHGFFF
jgi:protein ImuB